MKNKILNFLIILLTAILFLTGCTGSDSKTDKNQNSNTNYSEINIKENGRYSSAKEVAKYIYEYGKLPLNFITKKEAEQLGWKSDEGNLWDVTDKMSIGGDYFGNREKKLPSKSGRKYFECDVNYNGGFRGAERIVYSNDGLIYYSDDHYETFTQLYSEEGGIWKKLF